MLKSGKPSISIDKSLYEVKEKHVKEYKYSYQPEKLHHQKWNVPGCDLPQI